LLGDFELNRSVRLFLDYHRSIAEPSRPRLHHRFQPNEIAAPELGVNSQVEHREIASAAFELEPSPGSARHPSALRALLTD
jgi:hypothetical protein